LIDIFSTINLSSSDQSITEFKLTFTFKENDFIWNSTLSKTFYVKHDATSLIDNENYLDRTKGDIINWKENMNLTIETSYYLGKVISTNNKAKSFFSFFDDEEDSLDAHDQYVIGKFILDDIIPNVIDEYSEYAKETYLTEDTNEK